MNCRRNPLGPHLEEEEEEEEELSEGLFSVFQALGQRTAASTPPLRISILPPLHKKSPTIISFPSNFFHKILTITSSITITFPTFSSPGFLDTL